MKREPTGGRRRTEVVQRLEIGGDLDRREAEALRLDIRNFMRRRRLDRADIRVEARPIHRTGAGR